MQFFSSLLSKLLPSEKRAASTPIFRPPVDYSTKLPPKVREDYFSHILEAPEGLATQIFANDNSLKSIVITKDVKDLGDGFGERPVLALKAEIQGISRVSVPVGFIAPNPNDFYATPTKDQGVTYSVYDERGQFVAYEQYPIPAEKKDSKTISLLQQAHKKAVEQIEKQDWPALEQKVSATIASLFPSDETHQAGNRSLDIEVEGLKQKEGKTITHKAQVRYSNELKTGKVSSLFQIYLPGEAKLIPSQVQIFPIQDELGAEEFRKSVEKEYHATVEKAKGLATLLAVKEYLEGVLPNHSVSLSPRSEIDSETMLKVFPRMTSHNEFDKGDRVVGISLGSVDASDPNNRTLFIESRDKSSRGVLYRTSYEIKEGTLSLERGFDKQVLEAAAGTLQSNRGKSLPGPESRVSITSLAQRPKDISSN